MWPDDIDKTSGMRLPLPDPATLDPVARAAYHESARPGASLAGLQGPGGVKLYSPGTIDASNRLNRYLRFEAGYSARTREITILATAREMDSQFEWVAHEDEALRCGVPAAVIDIIRHRKPTTGIERLDAVPVEIVRQMWREHKVAADLFAEAKALFGATPLVEIIMLSGNYAGTAVLLHAVDMQLHEGKAPLLPVP